MKFLHITVAFSFLGTTLPAFAQSAVLTGRDYGSRVNVRSAPTINSSSPHYGLVGDRVYVLGKVPGTDSYTWYYVRFPSGAKGWIRGDLVSVATNRQSPTSTSNYNRELCLTIGSMADLVIYTNNINCQRYNLPDRRGEGRRSLEDLQRARGQLRQPRIR